MRVLGIQSEFSERADSALITTEPLLKSNEPMNFIGVTLLGVDEGLLTEAERTQCQLCHPVRVMANEAGNLGITAWLVGSSREVGSVFQATHYLLQV